MNSGNSVDLTGHHRDGAAAAAWLFAVLTLGLDCLFKLLDLQPDLVQDPLQPGHKMVSTWFRLEEAFKSHHQRNILV